MSFLLMIIFSTADLGLTKFPLVVNKQTKKKRPKCISVTVFWKDLNGTDKMKCYGLIVLPNLG